MRPTCILRLSLPALALALACGSSQQPAAAPAAAPGAEAGAEARPPGELPGAEQVLDDFVAATGGRAAYEKLKTRVASGSFTVTSMSQPARFTMYQEAPRKMYLVIEMPGMGKEERGSDGQTAWSKSLYTGNRILEGEERAQLLRTAALRAEIEWRQNYTKVKTLGIEKVEGIDAYEVEMHTPEGTVEKRYYDVKSKLLLRSTLVQRSPVGEVPVDTVTSDYRKVGDLLISHKAVVKAMSMEQVLTLEKIDQNVPIEAARFEVPGDVRAAPAGQPPPPAPARPSKPGK